MKTIKEIVARLYKPSDIRFWILLFFIVRLYGITNPPLEVAHNWRQTTVTMVARNFLEIDTNILFPRIDFAGEKTGITGMEFPIFNYLIYLLSLVFGYQSWYGRLLNLLVSSIGIFYFSKIVQRFFSRKTALYASIILLSSVWFAFSRKIMPDTFSLSLFFIGFYYGIKYFGSHSLKFTNLLFYFSFISLGILSKLPNGYLLILFLPLLLKNKNNYKQVGYFMLASFISLTMVCVWYFIWVPHLVAEYGFWHFFMGKSITTGAQEILQNLNLALSRFYDTALKFIGFAVFMISLIHSVKNKETKIIWIFSLSFLSFLIIIFKAGFTFAHHSYYIIPFAPVMALVAGNGLSKIKISWLVNILILFICFEGILNQLHDFRIREKEAALLELESDIADVSSQDDLILINSGDFPTPMYFAHRKGWIAKNEDIQNEMYIAKLKEKGLKHIVILKRTFGSSIKLPYRIEFDNINYTIYQP